MSPSKTQKTAKRPAAKRSTRRRVSRRARSTSSSSKVKREVAQHPFAPGDEVTVHEAEKVTVERSHNQAAFSDPLSKAKVSKDGTLEIQVEKGRTYAVSGEVDGKQRYVTVPVLTD